MPEPYLGEIRLMSFSFPPNGWALCDGQLLSISQNQGLFALLGTNYGGDGRFNFALPDLRGRVPIHVGHSHTLGERGGEQAHTLSISEIDQHVHAVRAASGLTNTENPAGAVLARSLHPVYEPNTALIALSPVAVSNVGGSQPHVNMQPFLTLAFCIALQGLVPSPS